MSDYKSVTRHPNDGKYYEAQWLDDYFGKHRYGVRFPDDPVVYPAEQVKEAQLKTFWAADVFATLEAQGLDVLPFMASLQTTYDARWKRDPVGGEGALDWMSEMRGDDAS